MSDLNFANKQISNLNYIHKKNIKQANLEQLNKDFLRNKCIIFINERSLESLMNEWISENDEEKLQSNFFEINDATGIDKFIDYLWQKYKPDSDLQADAALKQKLKTFFCTYIHQGGYLSNLQAIVSGKLSVGMEAAYIFPANLESLMPNIRFMVGPKSLKIVESFGITTLLSSMDEETAWVPLSGGKKHPNKDKPYILRGGATTEINLPKDKKSDVTCTFGAVRFEVADKRIVKLLDLAPSFLSRHRWTLCAGLVGTVALGVLGLLAAPFTFGASLGLTMAAYAGVGAIAGAALGGVGKVLVSKITTSCHMSPLEELDTQIAKVGALKTVKNAERFIQNAERTVKNSSLRNDNTQKSQENSSIESTADKQKTYSISAHPPQYRF